MTARLHWVGNAYYTIPEFIKEAGEMGVSRRVPGHILKKMEFRDRVYLASRTKGLKAPVIFGYFSISRFKGLDVDWSKVPPHLQPMVSSVKPDHEEPRGCGTIRPGGLYVFGVPSVLQLKDAVQGTSQSALSGDLILFPKPYPQLINLKPFRGFRPFNEFGFYRDLKTDGTRSKLKGLYYA